MDVQTSPLKNPIFVALDVNSGIEALKLVDKVSPFVGGYKVGPRLILREGHAFVQKLAGKGQVFFDFKFHDITSTVLAAVDSAFEMGATYVTVHAANGLETLAELAALEKRLNAKRPFRVLAVTVLTNLSEGKLPAVFQNKPIDELVLTMAEEVSRAGVSGLVSSPHELSKLRKKFPNLFLVTPGIRRLEDGKQDQSRTLGPAEAIDQGANMLVVGRPIILAQDPAKAAKEYWKLLDV